MIPTRFDNEGFDNEGCDNDAPLLNMADNDHGGLPFFVRRYVLAINADNQTTRLHRHEYMQVNYVCSGKGRHFINGNEFSIYKGDIFVIPPFVPHRITAAEDAEVGVMEFEFNPGFVNQSFDSVENIESFFDFAYIEPFLVSEKLVKPSLNLSGVIQLEIEKLLDEVLLEYERKPSGFKLLIKAALLKLLVIVGREFTRGLEKAGTGQLYNQHRDLMVNAVKYIDEHYMDELNVEDMSRRFMLSQSYFSYLFKTYTLKTFTEYLNDVRMIHAMDLLRQSGKRVIDVCLDVGFNNVNHFIRQFKKHTGRSPLSYRRSLTVESEKGTWN